MRTIALALLLTTATAAAGDDVVKVAKEAKEARKKSTTKVITNEDVKKSKGTLIETSATSQPAGESQPGLVEAHDAAYRARIAAEPKIAAAEKVLAGLEKELAAIEQSYYEENDLDLRDTEIVKRFNVMKVRVDAAREDLDALKKLRIP